MSNNATNKQTSTSSYTDFKGGANRKSLSQSIESLYSQGTGSIYTNFPMPAPAGGKAPNLDTQRNEGVNFLTVGRNLRGTSGSESSSTTNTVGESGAGGRRKPETAKRGEIQISGFTPGKQSMSESDYGNGNPETAANSSWYRTNFSRSFYGDAISGISALGNDNTRNQRIGGNTKQNTTSY